MAILRIVPYVGNYCPYSENKLNFDPVGIERHYMCNFGNFGQWASFIMPKYGNFENHPVSRRPLSVERKSAQFRPAGVERQLYVEPTGATSETLASGQVSCPNMAILKNIQYLRNDCSLPVPLLSEFDHEFRLCSCSGGPERVVWAGLCPINRVEQSQVMPSPKALSGWDPFIILLISQVHWASTTPGCCKNIPCHIPTSPVFPVSIVSPWYECVVSHFGAQ